MTMIPYRTANAQEVDQIGVRKTLIHYTYQSFYQPTTIFLKRFNNFMLPEEINLPVVGKNVWF